MSYVVLTKRKPSFIIRLGLQDANEGCNMNTLRQLRNAAGLSQSALAKALNVHKSTVSLWESGKRRLPIMHARPLAEALDCSVDDVVTAAEASARASKSA
jgi:transcriptional regulator with XRE-family HTH domain